MLKLSWLRRFAALCGLLAMLGVAFYAGQASMMPRQDKASEMRGGCVFTMNATSGMFLPEGPLVVLPKGMSIRIVGSKEGPDGLLLLVVVPEAVTDDDFARIGATRTSYAYVQPRYADQQDLSCNVTVVSGEAPQLQRLDDGVRYLSN